MPGSTALVLPGRAYGPSAPLLFFAARVAADHGFDVVALEWDDAERPGGLDDAAVRAQVLAAVERHGEPDLVIAKSLGTRVAPLAAERGWPGVWLTPLLVDDAVAGALTSATVPRLAVGGLADEYWDAGVAERLTATGCQVLEVPDADHAMAVAGLEGGGVRTAEVHLDVAREVDAFLRSWRA